MSGTVVPDSKRGSRPPDPLGPPVGSADVTTFSDVTCPPASVATTRTRAAEPARSLTLIPSHAERAILDSMTATELPSPVPCGAPASAEGALAPALASDCGPTTVPATPLPVTAPRSPAPADDPEDPADRASELEDDPWRALRPNGTERASTATTTTRTAMSRRRAGGLDVRRGSWGRWDAAVMAYLPTGHPPLRT